MIYGTSNEGISCVHSGECQPIFVVRILHCVSTLVETDNKEG